MSLPFRHGDAKVTKHVHRVFNDKDGLAQDFLARSGAPLQWFPAASAGAVGCFHESQGTASPRTGTWRLANTKAVQEFLIRCVQAPGGSCSCSFCWSRRGYLAGQKQPTDDTDEIFDEQARHCRLRGCVDASSLGPARLKVCRALQCWLRDQGFPCGLNGENVPTLFFSFRVRVPHPRNSV